MKNSIREQLGSKKLQTIIFKILFAKKYKKVLFGRLVLCLHLSKRGYFVLSLF